MLSFWIFRLENPKTIISNSITHDSEAMICSSKTYVFKAKTANFGTRNEVLI